MKESNGTGRPLEGKATNPKKEQRKRPAGRGEHNKT